MLKHILNVYRLGIKELRTLLRDKIMLFLILYSFSLGIYVAGTAASVDIKNASIAFVDEDRSALSGRIIGAFYKPRFNTPQIISFDEIDARMDSGYYTFVVVIPDDFEKNVLKGQGSDVQLNIDATRMTQAGIGAGYIQQIIMQEANAFLETQAHPAPIILITNFKYNPNLTSSWFGSLNEVINNIITLSILLAGAALIREREHGTIEHLLVMPLHPTEIMLAKIWSMGFVILLGITFGLLIIVEIVLKVPLSGSMPLFLLSVFLLLFSTTSIGIFMGMIANTMPQMGMLFILIILPLIMLSGGLTPCESMPAAIQYIMSLSPTSHYVDIAKAILFRGAGIDIVWKDLVAIFTIGLFFFLFALLTFKKSLESQS
ncbi:MAG: type transport system permease protein [Campylobacterota bacterium]|nr:type transport system permease protein [Campylobacterota bacterium]